MPTTNQSIVVDASIAETWSYFQDFHDLSWASNVVPSVKKIGDVDGNKAGAKRLLNDAFHETLLQIDHAAHCLTYQIDDGPSPVSKDEVSDYFGVVRLTEEGQGRTLVEWSSSWVSDVEDAVEFCHGIYVAVLQELANSLQRGR
jgi:hypothetical protein